MSQILHQLSPATVQLLATTDNLFQDKMMIINSLNALIYCEGQHTSADILHPHVEGDWHNRWTPLRTLLESNQIPVYLAEIGRGFQSESQKSSKFQFAASAGTGEQLSQLLLLESVANKSSMLVAGCYAETLITDVTLIALREGYDTFVMWDRVWAKSKIGLELAKARLLQAGAVPTSIDQVLHQWG